MLYQSLKLTNGIWVLAELRIQPSNPTFTVRPLPLAVPVPLACPGGGDTQGPCGVALAAAGRQQRGSREVPAPRSPLAKPRRSVQPPVPILADFLGRWG